MPKFYFNVYDGIDIVDTVGTALGGLKEARREAIRYAGALLEEDAERISLGDEWRLEVTDEIGLVLFRLDLVIVESPAVKLAMQRLGELAT